MRVEPTDHQKQRSPLLACFPPRSQEAKDRFREFVTPAGLMRLETVQAWIVAEMPLSKVSSLVTSVREKRSKSGDCTIQRRGHAGRCATLGDISHHSCPVRVSTGQKC